MNVAELLRRLATLVEGGKVKPSEIHAIFNGSKVSTTTVIGVYEEGRLRTSSGVVELAPSTVRDVEWPKPVKPKPGLREKTPATFKKKVDPEITTKKDIV